MDTPYSGYCWDERGRGFRLRDPRVAIAYDHEYVRTRYEAIDDKVRALSQKRLAVLAAFAPTGGRLLDFGCGSGRLVEAAADRWDAWGYDLADGAGRRVNGLADLYLRPWDVVCFHDSLEHLPDPDLWISTLAPTWLHITVPNCARPDDPAWFMPWKHRRAAGGEHQFHWCRDSLDYFLSTLGYKNIAAGYWEDEFRPNPDQAEPNILSAIYKRP